MLSRPTAFAAAPRAINVTRPLSQSSQLFARKDAQGKDDMTIESNEYSKSGSDAASASVEKAAFDPKSTSPEEEHDTAGREAEHKSGVSVIFIARRQWLSERGRDEANMSFNRRAPITTH